MANNFRITKRRKGDTLHLQLTGNFDGSAAMELIYEIAGHTDSAKRIFIETDNLNALLPFGRQVFIKKSSLAPSAWQKLMFTGKHGPKLIPERPYVI